MAESIGGLRRTHYCGEVTERDLGAEITVAGFVQRQRDKGGLVFIDLRDRTGVLQLTLDDASPPEVFQKSKLVKSEFVLMARGLLQRRESPNPELPTGRWELRPIELRLLSEAQTPPFPIGDESVGDETSLKYRYLALRSQNLQQNLKRRHDIARVTREYFYENGFWEIETPMLIKSTPEGARDYLVPSRLHEGRFYALPQSPQMYKQLLMVAGCDRYIQLARCFRDEDLRADRQPEFTQIDLEMSFCDVDDILAVGEGYIRRLMSEVMGVENLGPLPRLTYREAMERYGTDKPDTRFGLELRDVSEVAKNCGFSVFADTVAAGGGVWAIPVKGGAAALSRKELDRLSDQAKGCGAKGLATVRWSDEAPNLSFGKFLTDAGRADLLAALKLERGDAALLIAEKARVALPALGQLRTTVAKKLNLVPQGQYNFLWITEFPFFERNEETGEWAAMHHPFTMPMDDCLDCLDSDPGRVRAKCYDLVLNGVELASGSMRITDPLLQQKMFRALGMTPEEIEAKFGFLVGAYRYGAPPHGGMALGLDRIAMLLCGADSLREVTAFPKLQNASEPMSDTPGPADPAQLAELRIRPV